MQVINFFKVNKLNSMKFSVDLHAWMLFFIKHRSAVALRLVCVCVCVVLYVLPSHGLIKTINKQTIKFCWWLVYYKIIRFWKQSIQVHLPFHTKHGGHQSSTRTFTYWGFLLFLCISILGPFRFYLISISSKLLNIFISIKTIRKTLVSQELKPYNLPIYIPGY